MQVDFRFRLHHLDLAGNHHAAKHVKKRVLTPQMRIHRKRHVRQAVQIEAALLQRPHQLHGLRLFEQRAANRFNDFKQRAASVSGAPLQAIHELGLGQTAAIEEMPVRTEYRGPKLLAQDGLRLERREELIRIPLQHHTAQIHDHIANRAHAESRPCPNQTSMPCDFRYSSYVPWKSAISPPSRISMMRVARLPTNSRSCDTNTSVPGYFSRPICKDSMVSMSM